MGKHPHAHNPSGRTPPALERDGQSVAIAPAYGSDYRVTGGRTKRRLPDASADGRSLCRVGPTEAIAYQQETERGGSWSHGAVTGRISGLSRCVPGRALRKNKIKFYAKALFRKSDNAPLLLSPCARRRLICSNVDDVW